MRDAVFLLRDHKWRRSPQPSGGRFGLCWLCRSLEPKAVPVSVDEARLAPVRFVPHLHGLPCV